VPLRAIEEREWPGAVGVIHRALFDQPFARQTYGESALARWGRSYDDYSELRHEHYSVALGAFAGSVIVGVALASLPGDCRACRNPSQTAPHGDKVDVMNWQYDSDRAAVHRAQPSHAWISKMTVEPALQGLGIGRSLLQAVTAHLPAGLPVLLECETHREPFYVASGFRRVTTIPDPAGPDALLLRRDTDAPLGSS
jgi:GNAT superfamily N-acetyltransferase